MTKNDSDSGKIDAGTKCLVPDCSGIGTRRGLCSSCRNAAKREIESGRTTEAELIAKGLLLVKRRKGRFVVALEKIRETKEKGGSTNVGDDRASAIADAGSSRREAAG